MQNSNYLPKTAYDQARNTTALASPLPEAANNEGRIRTLLDGQEKIIEALTNSLNVLRAKIDYVCFPEPPSTGGASDEGAIASEFEKQLARNNDIICFLINRTDSWTRSVRI